MYEQIRKHGEDIKALFALRPDTDPVKLCKSLMRLERKAHHMTTCLCNTNTLNLLELNKITGFNVPQASDDDIDKAFDGVRKSLRRILGIKPSGNQCPDDLWPVFINFDPRGYALKIHDSFIKERASLFYKDWGGYGILAPEFDGK